MTSPLPYMPFYVADYIVDTRHLSLAQRGAYTDLLFMMWKAGGSLPNDDRALARMLGQSVHNWRTIKPEVAALFYVSQDGTVLRQRRMDRELGHVAELSQKRSQAGRQGARKVHGGVTNPAPHGVQISAPLSA